MLQFIQWENNTKYIESHQNSSGHIDTAFLLPAVLIYFVFLPTWHDGFLAFVALGGILIGVALSAKELLILGRERFVHQGALALEALETVLMPVSVLVG